MLEKKGLFKSSLEKILGTNFGDKLDDYFMKMFEKYNRKKYNKYELEEFKLAFKSSKKESKHHPNFFQKKVLTTFENKIKTLENNLQISLN